MSAGVVINRYKRSADGSIVHRVDCLRAGRTAVPWNWADGYTADQILSAIASASWLRPCRYCHPESEVWS